MDNYEKELQENLDLLDRLKAEGHEIIDVKVPTIVINSSENKIGTIKNSYIHKLVSDKVNSILDSMIKTEEIPDDEDYGVTLKEEYNASIEGIKRAANDTFKEQNYLLNMPTEVLKQFDNDKEVIADMSYKRTKKRINNTGSFSNIFIILFAILTVGFITFLMITR